MLLKSNMSMKRTTPEHPFTIYTGPEEEEKCYQRKSSSTDSAASLRDSLRSSITKTNESSPDDIYYFGVGPIVNQRVRIRQEVDVSDEQAAVLNDYRLTFVKGGIANVVPSRGYEVHGILMKFDSGWEEYLKQNSGNNVRAVVEVFPYNGCGPILANVFSLPEDDVNPDSDMEQPAEERYLKLIADGLRQLKIDEDYIDTQIMAVPYVAALPPNDWQKFPCKNGKSEDELPKITARKYEQLCRKQKGKKAYFVIGGFVMELIIENPNNPGAKWFLENAHGMPDMTWAIYQLVVSSDVPAVDSPLELTPLHTAWAEDSSMRYLERCNMAATKCFQLCDEKGIVPRRVSKLFRRSKILTLDELR